MSRTHWEKLIKRFVPDDARICNCGQAYERRCGEGIQRNPQTGRMEARKDMWACPGGCGAAQIDAQEHVAKCVRKLI